MASNKRLADLRWRPLASKSFLIFLCSAALLTSPEAKAWRGPFPLDDKSAVVTDKPLIAVASYSCHASGGFAFRVASDSKFKRVGKEGKRSNYMNFFRTLFSHTFFRTLFFRTLFCN